jgi:hypothetical protein
VVHVTGPAEEAPTQLDVGRLGEAFTVKGVQDAVIFVGSP